MPHQHRFAQVQGPANFLDVAVQPVVFLRVIRLPVRPARAHMVEEHHAVLRGQRGREVASQVLAVAEAIAEQRGARTLANDADVVLGR